MDTAETVKQAVADRLKAKQDVLHYQELLLEDRRKEQAILEKKLLSVRQTISIREQEIFALGTEVHELQEFLKEG